MTKDETRNDDELIDFDAHGLSVPDGGDAGYVQNDGAKIWYASFGTGNPVFLLHGGMGNSGNWAKQIAEFGVAGYRVLIIDSRGQGRSSRDDRPFSYELMASDLFAVMDVLSIGEAGLVGWSDGACTALIAADQKPDRVKGVFFFACNMDPSGTKDVQDSPILGRCFSRHVKDYKALSPTPGQFDKLFQDLMVMQRNQPNYTVSDLKRIRVPVAIVQSEHDEFIKPEHALYLAKNIPGARYVELAGVSHFAPIQRPGLFNGAVLKFLKSCMPV